MASKKFEKGSPEWEMFSDYWLLCQKYWEVEENDEYWNEAMQEAKEFRKKYERTNPIFSMEITLAFISTIDKKYKDMKK